MPPTQIALVRYHDRVPIEEFLVVAGALQTQATRDVAPAWDVQAVISPFLDLKHVPPGYFPLLVVDDVGAGHSYHVPGQGLPMAMVQYKEGTAWSVLASHEMIEMLVDPWGNLTASSWTPENGLRQYLVEVCDPCQDVFYLIGDVPVSDFVTPSYFDPSTTRDVRYSFTGALRTPLTPTPGGSLSYTMPDGSIRQITATDEQEITPGKGGPLREEIGKAVRVNPLLLARIAATGDKQARESALVYAERLAKEVDDFVQGSASQGAGDADEQQFPGSKLPNQRQRILALLEQLGNPAYTTYHDFKADPASVYEQFGITNLPDSEKLEEFKTKLAPQSHFAQVMRSHRTGTLLGSPDEMDYTQTHAGFFGWP